MMNNELWETANGVLAILGLFVVGMVIFYLVRNIHKTYEEPIRLVTVSFCLVILGHTMKDGWGYMARCCHVDVPNWSLVVAVACVALGKLGCIRIWSEARWGNWPWIAAVLLAVVFVFFNEWSG